MNIFRPEHIEIKGNQTGETFIGKFITFIVTGTWLVSIDNLVFMPGDSFPYDIQGVNGHIELTPDIRFIEDLSETPSVKSNKRLKKGKFIEVIVLKLY